ncbi:hypothetical protein Rs2_38577 [Raphanus sativus]|nr:hypothetical protein Rs2_38577 [Raphanus sativus]
MQISDYLYSLEVVLNSGNMKIYLAEWFKKLGVLLLQTADKSDGILRMSSHCEEETDGLKFSEKLSLQNLQHFVSQREMEMGCKTRNKGRMVRKLRAPLVQEMFEVKAQILYKVFLVTGLACKSNRGQAGNLLTGTTFKRDCAEMVFEGQIEDHHLEDNVSFKGGSIDTSDGL